VTAPGGKALARITAARAVDIGVPPTALNGTAIDTAGKVAVLDFWATDCMPCMREIPGLNKLHLARHPMDYPVALGPPALGTRYGRGSVPGHADLRPGWKTGQALYTIHIGSGYAEGH